jgi:calcium-dependent protein kinase
VRQSRCDKPLRDSFIHYCRQTACLFSPSLAIQEEAASIFAGIDADHSNSLSYTEFLAASLSRRLWLTRERIRDAFRRLDVDKSGYITRDNLKSLLGDDWTPEKADQMMAEADEKGDGRIGA